MNAIEQLMERKGKFDYILLETTGLADPGNIAPMFWMDDGLASTIYLDGIVTLVDAKNILRSLDDPAGKVEGHEESEDAHGPVMTTAHVQISHADVIVINKSDLVSEPELQAVKDRIESINGLAKIFITSQSVVPKLEGFLLDLHAYDRVEELDRPELGHSHLDKVRAPRPAAWSNCGIADRDRQYRPSRSLSPSWPRGSNRRWMPGCDRCSGKMSSPATSRQTVQHTTSTA